MVQTPTNLNRHDKISNASVFRPACLKASVLQSATGCHGQISACRPFSIATSVFTDCAPYVGRNTSILLTKYTFISNRRINRCSIACRWKTIFRWVDSCSCHNIKQVSFAEIEPFPCGFPQARKLTLVHFVAFATKNHVMHVIYCLAY